MPCIFPTEGANKSIPVSFTKYSASSVFVKLPVSISLGIFSRILDDCPIKPISDSTKISRSSLLEISLA
jgi:hypothetical protein